MGGNDDRLQMESIPESIRQTLQDFVRDIGAALPGQLISVTVVGSCLTADFRPGQSDINTVLVFDVLGQAQLKALAGLAKAMHKRQIAPPLLMTVDYIERSRDVFGVELLDFQLTGQTILGNNPFVDLQFAANDVRLQCERELKAMLVRLRQAYIAAGGKIRPMQDVLVSTAKSLLPYLRAMLWMHEGNRNPEVQATLDEAARILSLDKNPLHEVLNWRLGKLRLRDTDIEQAFDRVYAIVKTLALDIDRLGG